MAPAAMKKPFLIMKLTVFLTIFSVFHSFAGVKGQTITLDMKDTEIRKVLTKIDGPMQQEDGTYRI